MKRLLIIMLLAVGISAQAQNRKQNRNVGGRLTLGVRSTVSLFSDDGGNKGMGAGGQFRLRFYDFMNSEWFGDYIMTSIGTVGTRTDYHVGWSVMFYAPSKKGFKMYRPKPYLLVGHCFDYTSFHGTNPFYQSYASASRWSSAVQGGLGFHIPFTEKVDLSVSGQYMMHLGKEVLAEERTAGNGDKFLHAELQDNAGLDGHLLVSFSLNVQIADLWRDHGKHGGAGTAAPDPDGQNPNYIQQ